MFHRRARESGQGGAVSLERKKSEFVAMQSRVQDGLFESLASRCDEILAPLEEEGALSPSEASQQPHECVSELVDYLREAFSSVGFLPRATIEACEFATCRHVAQFLQQVLTEGEVGEGCG